MSSLRSGYWAVVSLCGAFLWAGLAGLAGAGRVPLGVIELLFLFAPLVIVPLGLELAECVAPSHVTALSNMIRVAQPLAAACVVASFSRGPGRIAAAWALPWVLICAVAAISGLAGLIKARGSLSSLVANIARIDLAVGGGWLLLSRLGMQPLGFQEPIDLLTAVHFHYSGFAASLIAAAFMRFRVQRGTPSVSSRCIVLAVGTLPFLLAAGFVLSPALKVIAAGAFAMSMAVLAVMSLAESAEFHNLTARIMVRFSSTSLLLGMALAATYAVGDYLHLNWILIPRMASTHGLLNALGFAMAGLLGWLIEQHTLLMAKSLEQRKTVLDPAADPEIRTMFILTSSKLPEFSAREFHDR